MSFTPDYQHIVDSANNRKPKRLPLYEHIICDEIMEQVTGKEFSALSNGDDSDIAEYVKRYCDFFLLMGYDTVSYEQCIGPIMPGSGSLGRHVDGVIKKRKDFMDYPWDKIPDIYFEKNSRYFRALRDAMPTGMSAIGGVGNGVFECVQDITGYMDLCFLIYDDPELFADLFIAVGDISFKIWDRFLKEFGDIFCVCRFGDDLGYRTDTLLPPSLVKEHIIPQYARIIKLVHKMDKPFLLHSCGNIWGIMDDLISVAQIDAKHSNEDQIAAFPEWVQRYGNQIGNFGGIDTDAVCRLPKQEMQEYIVNVIDQCSDHGGFAFGSGNSIPEYVPVDQYVFMTEVVRRQRGE